MRARSSSSPIPFNAVLILLAMGAALYHMRIGMQVVIEDYIAKNWTKIILLMLNTFIVRCPLRCRRLQRPRTRNLI